MIKDVIQHWPADTIKEFLPGLKKYSYILIINCAHQNERTNIDIEVGDYRPLGLTREPFDYDVEELFSFSHRDNPEKTRWLKKVFLLKI